MDVILGHENHDFDSVASMVAAKKLHPSASLYLQPTAEGGVLNFLNLYREHFSFFRYSQFRDRNVDTLIVVDTNRRDRLGPYANLLDEAHRVVLYDHHPPGRSDLPADEVHVDSVGALITLMVEKIRGENLEVNPYEATLFMLGLHQETGGLQFGNTTVRDYEVGRYLMERGADLDVVQNFCHQRLSDDKLELFNELMNRCRNVSINDVPVTIATAERDEYVPEIALLAHKIRDTQNANLLFVIVQMGDRIQLVIRNRYEQVDAASLAAGFGGGGHARAASATISGVTLEETEEALIDTLKNQLKPRMTAREIMTSPVHSIRPDLPVEEAQKVMLRLGHHGLPITDDDDRLVGIITRTDVDKSLEHDLTHAPVKGFMNPEVVTVPPDTGLEQLQKIIANEQIGRLPVVEDEKLIGIVTRTDIIKVLHHRKQAGEQWVLSRAPSYSGPTGGENLRGLVEDVLEERWFRRLREWGRLARDLDESLFLVGGCVRDILLEEPTQDIDLIVEGDGIAFARALCEETGGDCSAHEQFQTAVVTLPNGETVDVATARSEYYSHPAALPDVEVEHASIVQDLRRRDFTINAMAINLSPDSFGDLLDLYGGRKDLEDGLIRILYAMSFMDDPTRILRAIRFAGRLDFDVEKRTLFQLRNALQEGVFEAVSGDRLRYELDLILEEKRPWPVLERLFENDVLQTLQPGLQPEPEMPDWFERFSRIRREYRPFDERVVRYGLLFEPLEPPVGARLARRLNFRREQVGVIEQSLGFDERRSALEEAEEDSRLYRILEDVGHREVLLIQACIQPEPVCSKLLRYLDDLSQREPLITGETLVEWGVEPGPRMGELLDELFDRQLDGELSTVEEARDYLGESHPDVLNRSATPRSEE